MMPLPTGTVVFLFTDIEGSTTRWDADRVAMQAAVRRHDAVMRAAIEEHGGYVFKTIGDAFCAAFQSADDALAAAVDAQTALGLEDFSAVNGLRVRMAIHGGESDERDGDYFGPPVNRVARLLSAGHGAQVLVSGVIADLAGGGLAGGVGLRHLGTLPLKDLKDPERVYQLTAPALTGDFKPLRLLERPPNNLPHLATSFVGRDDDLARIKDVLNTARLVTIAGPGGVGKTRLALQAIEDTINDSGEGAWVVDLAPIGDPSLVTSATLAVLGADQQGDAPQLDLLVAHLTPRRLLIFFDNCEHLVAEVATITAAIVARCPHVTVLCTSREALNVNGERVYRLAPFDAPQAVRLFAERAATANAQFAITDANRATVESICVRLDGIALAIELAAARMRSMSLDDLAKRLGERFRLLTGGSRTALPRQQTMRALIDWSYDLLADQERVLLRRIAIFRGGFTLDAATRVCSGDLLDEWTILDALTSIADKSLIVVDTAQTEQRYRLLESVREYGIERLEEGDETAPVAQRHAEAFAAISEAGYQEWDTAPAPDWLPRLAREIDNLRAALTWSFGERHDTQLGARIAANYAPVFLRTGLLHEGLGWLDQALCIDSPAAATEARAHYLASMLHNNQGSLALALDAAERALALYRNGGDRRGLTRALSQVVQLYTRQWRRDEAIALGREAVGQARKLNDPRLLASVLQRCAMAFDETHIEEARAQFAECLSIFRSLGRDDETARALMWWAGAEASAESYERARDLSLEALQIAGRDSQMYLRNSMASYSLSLRDFATAAIYIRETLASAGNERNPVTTAGAILYAAMLIARKDARASALLFGYATARLADLNWQGAPAEEKAQQELRSDITSQLTASAFEALCMEGAGWSEDRAIIEALSSCEIPA